MLRARQTLSEEAVAEFVTRTGGVGTEALSEILLNGGIVFMLVTLFVFLPLFLAGAVALLVFRSGYCSPT